MTTPVIALLGRKDEPTDAVEEYCRYLGAALRAHDIDLDIRRVPWEVHGWPDAFQALRLQATEWRDIWVLVQYTALAWSVRGFPQKVLRALKILKSAGARVGIVFHDVEPYPGERLTDSVRRFAQVRTMRRALVLADLAIFTVPPERLSWLSAAPACATFIPVGPNLPIPPTLTGLSAPRPVPTIGVFSITGGEAGVRETQIILAAVRHAAQKLGKLRLSIFGRHAELRETELREGLRDLPVELLVEGVVEPAQVVQKLSVCDVLLFVRGPISSRRSSAIAGIACGLPVIAFPGPETAPPLTDAGVVLVQQEQLNTELVRILSDSQYREALAARSRTTYESHFAWSSIAARCAAFLTQEPEPRYRVLAIGSHPVQYMAPLLCRMALHPQLDLSVAYCALQGAQSAHDPGFNTIVKWDIPLLEGYSWQEVPNRGSGAESFWGLYNPGLSKHICAGKFDAVLCYLSYLRASFWISYFAARRSGSAFLFGTDASSLSPRNGAAWKVFLKRAFWPKLFSLADQVIVPSTAARDLMLSLGVPPERLTLTPYSVDNEWWIAQSNKVDREAVRANWGATPHTSVILFCAKLQPWKRPQDILRAFVQAKLSDALLVYAGEGAQRQELETEATALGVGKRVRFLGFLNQSQLPAVYTAADLMILPSEYEPFAVVVNEASCCSCPVIASDRVGAARDLIAPVYPGLIYPCGDIRALSALLDELCRDHGHLHELGRAAKDRMASWSPQETVAGTVVAVGAALRRRQR